MLCASRKLIMLWQYSSDDMPLLATTMQMNITLYDYNCKRYEEANNAEFICLVSCTRSWIGNDTIHGINAVWNTSRSWTYKHSDHQSCFMIGLSTYCCIVRFTIINDIRRMCIVFTYSNFLEMLFYVGVWFFILMMHWNCVHHISQCIP